MVSHSIFVGSYLLPQLKTAGLGENAKKMNIENEGESHDVVDNKGPGFLSHDLIDNKAI